ncbi:MAG: ABC transporter permease [Clostridiales bacterium]|nr:ABC transporter permease [Clostridiales bacterium]
MKLKQGLVSFLSSLVAIVAGLIFCQLLLFFVVHKDAFMIINGVKVTNSVQIAFNKFATMITIGMTQPNLTSAMVIEKIAKIFYTAAPLLMTGLSVGFAFKTGLFNIGASGQFTVGAFAALALALLTGKCEIVDGVRIITPGLPWYWCLLGALIAGAAWGIFPGLFKALFNVNEVITSIMFNWIGLNTVNLLCMNIEKMTPPYWVGSQLTERTAPLNVANPGAVLPKWFLGDLFKDPASGKITTYINIGILIAVVFAVICWFILNRTTFGYELKACGNNRNASLYAGINAKRNIVLSMVIAGALAGLGGGIAYLAGTMDYTIIKSLLPQGFDGITVALLATSHPLGIIFSALFVSYVNVGGESLQPIYSREVVNIAVAVILYLSAFALLIKLYLGKVFKFDKSNVNAETAPVAAAPIGELEAPIAEEKSEESEVEAQ